MRHLGIRVYLAAMALFLTSLFGRSLGALDRERPKNSS